jgi:hypothetical protein
MLVENMSFQCLSFRLFDLNAKPTNCGFIKSNGSWWDKIRKVVRPAEIDKATRFFSRRDSLCWVRAPLYRGLTTALRQTPIGRTPLDQWSVRSTDLCLKTHHTHQRQTYMPPAGFDLAIITTLAGANPQIRPHDRWEWPKLANISVKSVISTERPTVCPPDFEVELTDYML